MEYEQSGKFEESASALLALKKLKDQLVVPESNDMGQHPSFRKMWEVLAGSQLEQMLGDVEKAKQHLRDTSWQMRLAAISILRQHWKQYEELAPVLERMAFEDSNPQVLYFPLTS